MSRNYSNNNSANKSNISGGDSDNKGDISIDPSQNPRESFVYSRKGQQIQKINVERFEKIRPIREAIRINL